MPWEKHKDREMRGACERGSKRNRSVQERGKVGVRGCSHIFAYFATSSSKATSCLQHIWEQEWKLNSSSCSFLSSPQSNFADFYFFLISCIPCSTTPPLSPPLQLCTPFTHHLLPQFFFLSSRPLLLKCCSLNLGFGKPKTCSYHFYSFLYFIISPVYQNLI